MTRQRERRLKLEERFAVSLALMTLLLLTVRAVAGNAADYRLLHRDCVEARAASSPNPGNQARKDWPEFGSVPLRKDAPTHGAPTYAGRVERP